LKLACLLISSHAYVTHLPPATWPKSRNSIPSISLRGQRLRNCRIAPASLVSSSVCLWAPNWRSCQQNFRTVAPNRTAREDGQSSSGPRSPHERWILSLKGWKQTHLIDECKPGLLYEMQVNKGHLRPGYFYFFLW